MRIIDLKNFYNEISYCLTNYHLRHFKALIKGLEDKLKAKYNLNEKTKAFAFKSKFKFKTVLKVEKQIVEENIDAKVAHKFDTAIDTLCGRTGEKLVLGADVVKDHYKLKDLTDCEVIINAVYKTLYLENLRNCRVYSGVVENSIFGENIFDSELDCIAQQIRIHKTHNAKFNVFVISNMIIEDSDGLKVSKWHSSSSEVTELFGNSMFKGKINNWADVKDFNWIKATASPNFEIIA